MRREITMGPASDIPLQRELVIEAEILAVACKSFAALLPTTRQGTRRSAVCYTVALKSSRAEVAEESGGGTVAVWALSSKNLARHSLLIRPKTMSYPPTCGKKSAWALRAQPTPELPNKTPFASQMASKEPYYASNLRMEAIWKSNRPTSRSQELRDVGEPDFFRRVPPHTYFLVALSLPLLLQSPSR